jgi:hypothetical protein
LDEDAAMNQRVWAVILILLASVAVPSSYSTVSAGFLSEIMEGLNRAGRAALRTADKASVIAAVRGARTEATGNRQPG